jgi:TRAP-type C4-dicarboxylate transport system substrate-binding protein
MRKKRSFMKVFFMAAVPLVPAAFADSAAAAQKLTISPNRSLKNPWQKVSLKFAETIHPKTGGKSNVEGEY